MSGWVRELPCSDVLDQPYETLLLHKPSRDREDQQVWHVEGDYSRGERPADTKGCAVLGRAGTLHVLLWCISFLLKFGSMCGPWLRVLVFSTRLGPTPFNCIPVDPKAFHKVLGKDWHRHSTHNKMTSVKGSPDSAHLRKYFDRSPQKPSEDPRQNPSERPLPGHTRSELRVLTFSAGGDVDGSGPFDARRSWAEDPTSAEQTFEDGEGSTGSHQNTPRLPPEERTAIADLEVRPLPQRPQKTPQKQRCSHPCAVQKKEVALCRSHVRIVQKPCPP